MLLVSAFNEPINNSFKSPKACRFDKNSAAVGNRVEQFYIRTVEIFFADSVYGNHNSNYTVAVQHSDGTFVPFVFLPYSGTAIMLLMYSGQAYANARHLAVQ